MVTFTNRDDLRQSYTGRNPVDRSSVSGPNRDLIREARAKGQLNRMPRDNFISRGVEKASQGMNMLPTPMGMIAPLATHVIRTQVMAGQNRDYFGGNWLHSKIPQNVRESMMTQKDQDFYDKYMNLASLAQGNQEKQEYLDTANTAIQNSQNTARLNYGLSQIDPEGEYLNREGLPSYSQDLFGEGYNRFNMDRFKEAMGMGEGILDAIPAEERHPDVIDNYSQETFLAPPTQEILSDTSEDIIETSNLPIDPMPTANYLDPEYFNWIHKYQDDYLPSGEHKDGEITRTIPGYNTVPLQEQEQPEPLPFNDAGREAGIASMYGQGPQWGSTNRRYEGEYRDHISRTGDRISYEEFERAYERMYQGKPHKGEIYQSAYGNR